ncbi:Calx-beta domain-containing protein [Mangrovimicrobium sediminis]|uniref:Calx-beta domain-containing protein n=1 Tax=Mangrovimicrobium sediminis TaxID=2562682 RepID=UPI0014367CA1|nr:Calx-beta domain-containing protein [Haliea sp. SAOS-164]
MSESAGTALFPVSLNKAPKADRPVSVPISTRDRSAEAGSDYLATSATLVFTSEDWEQPRFFAVVILDDGVAEENERFQAVLSKPQNGRIADKTGVARIIDDDEPVAAVSINSTSVPGLQPLPFSPVPERPRVSGGVYTLLAVNDLGMHCLDLDGRIANILPPFQVMLAQVVRRGARPELNPAEVALYYSAASNPDDPILAAGGPRPGIAPDGSLFKTNFWQMIDRGAWASFYPPVLPVPLADLVNADQGLLVPNTELLYIGPDGIVDGVAGSADGELEVSQQLMPGSGDPLVTNQPQPVLERYGDKPFFINFPFGYVAADVDWHEAAGIPFSPFDDLGRQNPFPLVRVEARLGDSVLATSDAVLPVSSETSCSNCHGALADVPQRLSTAPLDALVDAGLPVADRQQDPLLGSVPTAVSIEYGADINILRLHDLKHGATYVDTGNAPAPCDILGAAPNGDLNCLARQAIEERSPVVCQNCHYTPALDLAQVGPVAGPAGSEANGRNQLAHESNSRVMHNHHGALDGLFPAIPPAVQNPLTGAIENQDARLAALEENCYQCHPGKDTQCLRGAMYNGGMLCSDCHGDLQQIGADFSAGVSSAALGAFQLGLGNFYDPDSPQPRVPWANEPGCGSCHTGDANDNLAGEADVMVNHVDSNGVSDGIRLRQAFRLDDPKATPIVPQNKLFAEPAVPASFNGFANPGAGNPQLYRVSTGHGGVMCEGCHGATHAEWPVAEPLANDNLLALQLQGHAGPIGECSACHDTAAMSARTLDGPHNMHLVDDPRFWREAHKDLAKRENGRPGGGLCGDCHGADHLGSVLSRTPVARSFSVEGQTRSVAAGEPVACNLCHSLGKSFER